MKYYTQLKSKSGYYWFDVLGTDNFAAAHQHGRSQKEPYRVIERFDAVVGSDEHKLLLAAPDLLAALCNVIANVDLALDGSREALYQIRAAAQDAINKATGE